MNANEGKSFAQSAFGVRAVLGPWDNPEAGYSQTRPQYPTGLASLFVPVLGSIQNDSRRRVAFPKLRKIEQKFLFLFACIRACRAVAERRRVIRGQLFGCPNAFGLCGLVVRSLVVLAQNDNQCEFKIRLLCL
jgi:hypothetical protein